MEDQQLYPNADSDSNLDDASRRNANPIGADMNPEADSADLHYTPDNPQVDDTDTLEPDGGENGDDTQPGTGTAIGG
jgi:hypothetical protein